MKQSSIVVSRVLLIACALLLQCTTGDEPLPGVELLRRCNLVPDPGPCYAMFERYYYDPAEKKCKSFIWGGCAGVVPFETMEECRACQAID